MRLVALAVLVAVAVPLVIVALSGGGEEAARDSAEGALRLERSPTTPEVIVYMEDSSLNDTETTDGRARVTIECLDGGGTVVFSRAFPWPFVDTDGGTLSPHQHLTVHPSMLQRVTSCRLRGTDPPLTAELL
jgi:hypothetical protein